MPSTDHPRPARSPSGNRVNPAGCRQAELREQAHRLARGEGLPFALAMQVVEGCLSLADAVARVEEPEVEILADESRRPARTKGLLARWTVYIVLATIAVCIAVLGWTAWHQYENQRQHALESFRAKQALAAALVRTDGSGVVTEVSGPSAGTVLTAFCAADVDGYEPVAIVPTAQPGVWLGIIQQGEDTENQSAVRIERRQGGKGWAAGDGEGPITLEQAPQILEDTPRMPVDP